MWVSTVLTTSLAAMATASPIFSTSTRTSTNIRKAAPEDVPTCIFDPVKGVYVCLTITPDAFESVPKNDNINVNSEHGTGVAAGECEKCPCDQGNCYT